MKVRFATVKVDDIIGFLRRNAQAVEGYPVGPFKWRVRLDMFKKNKPVFRAAMTASVKKDGIRNPLLGWCFEEGLFVAFGNGRLQAAKEAGLDTVPMIINDFTGEYDDCPEVTEENLYDWFTDPPITYAFRKTGFTYHYNLTPSTREVHDPSAIAFYDGDVSDFYDEFPYLRGCDEGT